MASWRSRASRSLAAVAVVAAVVAGREERVSTICQTGVVFSFLGNQWAIGTPSTSADGRFTSFSSFASDLVPGDTNERMDVFVLDRTSCALELVSPGVPGGDPIRGAASPSISDDGRLVAFESDAALVPEDTNGRYDVYLRDRTLGTLVRISTALGGGDVSLDAASPAISGDGRFIAFVSMAWDLVANDLNGAYDVFVRDLAAGVTERVSLSTGGTEGTGSVPVHIGYPPPDISADGRYVVFGSRLNGLVPGDTNLSLDIFRRDRLASETALVSVAMDGSHATSLMEDLLSISGTGRFVGFTSSSANIVPGDTNAVRDAFVRDMDAQVTERVSVTNDGSQANLDSFTPSINADGRFISFISHANNLVLGETGFHMDIFVRDRLLGLTRRVSQTFDGQSANNNSVGHEMSADGRMVAFTTQASNLSPLDTNGAQDVFITEWPLLSGPANIDLIRNGGFAGGTANWLQFATPDASYLVGGVNAGVFEFYRNPPPPGQTGQAVIFQPTTIPLIPFAPLVATFDLGNSSTARKRISVLIHDLDFSDLHVCTFWLLPNAPMRSYTMRTHTLRYWANATISFYAATPGGDAGYNRVDNVTLTSTPAGFADRTVCVDPTPPVVPGGPATGNLLTNGDFSNGLAPWGLFGQIVSQITGGVFEFYRPAGTPAGVVLQATGIPMLSGQIWTARLDLGNSSTVRKRATVLIHEADFSDLAACTFWLEPNTPMQTHIMRAATTKAWTNATFSVYPATVGTAEWILLDNALLQQTPATVSFGTECYEPGSIELLPGTAPRPGGVAVRPGREAAPPDRVARVRSDPGTTDGLRRVVETSLSFRVPPSGAPFEIQVSADGEAWTTLTVIEPSDAWRVVTVDVRELGEGIVYVRLTG